MNQRPARFDTGGATAEETAAWEAEQADTPVDTPVDKPEAEDEGTDE